MDNELQALNRSPVFAALQPKDLQLMVGAMARRKLRARQTVFDQGSPGDSMFVLAEGRLAVRYRRRDRPGLVVDEMSPGAVVGEMACLDPAPRSASTDVVVRRTNPTTMLKRVRCSASQRAPRSLRADSTTSSQVRMYSNGPNTPKSMEGHGFVG